VFRFGTHIISVQQEKKK